MPVRSPAHPLTLRRPSRTRRRFSYVAVAAVLGLGACGGGGGDGEASDPTTAPVPGGVAVPGEDAGDDDPAEPASAEDAPEPVALLPLESRAPAGFRQLAANCDPGFPSDPNRTEGEEPDFEDGEDSYSTWITYAVPEEWGIGGRGAAGSGGVTGTDEDRSFTFDPENSSKGRLEVDVSWANVDPDGEVSTWDGEPWEGFDYEMTVGDDAATITYENVATVTVGDQEIDLFHMDPAQAPDHVSETEYAMLIDVMELPGTLGLGGFTSQPYAVFVAISFDGEKNPVDQETIEKIVGSFTLPTCTWERTLLDHEMIVNLDLNGDGHIRTPEEAQAEAQAKYEEMLRDLDQP